LYLDVSPTLSKAIVALIEAPAPISRVPSTATSPIVLLPMSFQSAPGDTATEEKSTNAVPSPPIVPIEAAVSILAIEFPSTVANRKLGANPITRLMA
jgi:hypothetical protein